MFHLTKKVYLSLDVVAQYRWDHLIVSYRPYATTETVVTDLQSIGQGYGNYKLATDVDWATFFNNANKRTVIYASPDNFVSIYSSYLKTVTPNISEAMAFRMMKQVLKWVEWHHITYNYFHTSTHPTQKENLSIDMLFVKDNFTTLFNQAPAWNVSIEPNIELSIAKYWANGSKLNHIKSVFTKMAIKAILSVGRESKHHHMKKWFQKNANANLQVYEAALLADSVHHIIAGPLIDDRLYDEYVATNGIGKIKDLLVWILSDHNKTIVVEYQQFLTLVANNLESDWDIILNKDNPLPIMSVICEPIYRSVVNGWLITWLSSRTQSELLEFV
jgi:hypothetical protein